ncbi:uncharacterized protein LOC132193371 [Neocloeon triangulifer]|uniref:uncharacterized protein LOC132193371 n=1 Tax=Neocloeon triangulifer TaxID=2078957 RepID=UPI00286F5561|nr:uncharacterized protein LOC132193371 [Neocloeon triangulifer]XP_059469985.1 uncharacterized protein LOC132193371 [Neocloeon triangulifer]XP_059469986.1 uncharacterized protein LOC132193371 [Neocloeon triangulifer]
MSAEASDRKLMNPSTEAQFFQFLRQLSDSYDDDVRAKTIKTLSATRNLELSPKGMMQFRQECNDKLVPVMETLIQRQNSQWADMWIFIIEQMGRSLHADNMFLNRILSVLEKGMKRKDTQSIMWSLNCWKVLIDNFALNPKMITVSRRVGLLAIPLKARNVRDSNVLEVKLKLWWHLFAALGAYMDMHAETVTKPFMLFAFGPFEQPSSYVLSKYPDAVHTALLLMTSLVATGVANEQLAQLETPFKSPIPLINDGKTFLCLADYITKSIDVLLKQPIELSIKPLEVLMTATIHRIVLLCNENTPFGSDILAQLLKILRVTLMDQIVIKKRYTDLLIFAAESLTDMLPGTLMDLKLQILNNTSPRDFLFQLLCHQEHLLLHAKPIIVKTEERQCAVLGRLLVPSKTLVVQPGSLARAMLLVSTLTELQNISAGEMSKKCLHLWEQCSRFMHKFPKEYFNKDSNLQGQQMYMDLILMPFKLILYGSLDTSLVVENAIVSALKTLFFDFTEAVHLSLSVDKVDPCQHMYSKITELLKAERYSPTIFQIIVKVVTKLILVRTSASYTRFFGKAACREAESAELKLLSKLTELLCKLVDESPSVAGKMTPIVAKALGNLALLTSSSDVIIGAIRAFYEIFTRSPVNHWPNNRMEVTDPWTSMAAPFKRAFNSESPVKRNELLALKPKLIELTDHPDIKVCNAAKEMIYMYSFGSKNEGPKSSTDVSTPKTPVLKRTTQSRKRSILLGQTPPPPTSQTSKIASPSQKLSPAKPSLEDLDSQDFVKITSQPKMKKPLTPHQREVKRRRREDIPALYQGLSQDTQMSQDTQDESPVAELSKPPPLMATSVWDEEAVDIDLAQVKATEEKTSSQETDENKSMNSQEEGGLVQESPETVQIVKESQDIEFVENSQNYSTVPIQTAPKPELDQAALQVMRACNRQGVTLPPPVRVSKEDDVAPVENESSAPVNKRKSLPPMKSLGPRGRAAQMVGLVTTTKEPTSAQESKQSEASAPQKVMSSLKALSSSKLDLSKQNDSSPTINSVPSSAVSSPLSSNRKRSNLKRDKQDESPSPSPKRSKRVSFAEPVVSGQQDSPNILQDIQVYNNYYKQSPATKKKMKASRKLLMAPKDGFQLIKEHPISQGSLENEEPTERDGPIEPTLDKCMVPLAEIAPKLVSPMLVDEFTKQMTEMNIFTVHDLNQLSDLAIAGLPLKEPKIATVKTVLKELVEAQEENCNDDDFTTEIEEMPLSQHVDTESISIVTTHLDTVPVIEEVITSEESSPEDGGELKEKPKSVADETEDKPVELVEASQPDLLLITHAREAAPEDMIDDQTSSLDDQNIRETKQVVRAESENKQEVEERIIPEKDEVVGLEADAIIESIDKDTSAGKIDSHTSQEVGHNSQILVESSLAMDTEVLKTQEVIAVKEILPESMDVPESPERVKTADEIFANLTESEKEKFRRLFLQQEDSKTLMIELESRNENVLASKSTSELLKELKSRSETSQILQMLDDEPEIQSYAENGVNLGRLMQKKPVDEVSADISLFIQNNLDHSTDMINKVLSSMDKVNLTNAFKNIEDKVCDSLSQSTVEDHVRSLIETNSEFAQDFLASLGSPVLVQSISDQCAKGKVSFSDVQANCVFNQIKSQVDESAEEIRQKFESKMDVGEISHPSEKLKNFVLNKCSEEEILNQIDLKKTTIRNKLVKKISNEEVLEMAIDKLNSEEAVVVSECLEKSLEKLAVYLQQNSMAGILQDKHMDDQVVQTCLKALMEKTTIPAAIGIFSEQQVCLLLETLLKDPQRREQLIKLMFGLIEDGEMMELFGKKRLTELMAVGVMSGDLEPMQAIFDVFCGTHIVQAACKIFKDGTSDAHVNMLKAAFPRKQLAKWVSEILDS